MPGDSRARSRRERRDRLWLLAPSDQITEREPDHAGNQHRGEGFLRGILTDVLSRPRTLVVEIARHLFGRRRDALDKLARLVHGLPAGLRCPMSQVLDHRLALIERGLQLLPDTLRGLIGRLASLLGGVSRYLPSPCLIHLLLRRVCFRAGTSSGAKRFRPDLDRDLGQLPGSLYGPSASTH